MKYRKINFRSVLVTFQYVVAVGLIFAVLVVGEQLKYVFNSDPGYDKEQILSVSLTPTTVSNLDLLKNRILTHSNVLSGAAASRIPTGSLNDSMGAAYYENDSATNLDFRLPYIGIDEDFLKTFGIDVLVGNDFEEHMKSDSIGYFMLNHKATKVMGFISPKDAIGQKIRYGGQPGRVIGVTKDFHFESIHNEIQPMIMVKTGIRYRRLNLKLNAENMESTLDFIEDEWNKIDPINPISYRFVDELFERQYIGEQRLSKVFKVFTSVAILISCLGMLGMVSFIIERKLKEIGIRKVLGASMAHVVWLISKYFSYLILIGSLIAIPVCGWLMGGWLEDFAYQITIGPLLVIVPIIAISVLSAITILYSTIRASLVNPVECLKDE